MSGVSIARACVRTRLRIDAAEFQDAWGQFHASGVEEKAVPEADEDAVTMAVEAAQRAAPPPAMRGPTSRTWHSPRRRHRWQKRTSRRG